jgi:hypothetical protein
MESSKATAACQSQLRGHGPTTTRLGKSPDPQLFAALLQNGSRHKLALIEFATRYNETWPVARHNYQTPAQVRAAQLRVAKADFEELRLAA